LKPTNPDVEGFHEGFSDLISLFQRFRYRPMVRRAIESMGGKLTSRLLVDIARQWGETTGEGKQDPIRKAFEREGDLDEAVKKKDRYRPTLECHDMGTVLLRAVFDAFRWIYANKTARLRALGPPGDARMPAELIDLLVIEAEQLAGQFLNILIRAVDYCPPVDLKLGEYLRAIVTADFDTMPDDPWAYREAFVRAFRRYGITVDSVADLSEDALRWCTPERPLAPIQNLFDEFKVGVNEVTHADDNSEAREFRATMLGHYITDPQFPERLYYFGLVPASTAKRIERPVIESVRILRRVSQDGTVYFDLVAEVVQRRKSPSGRWVYGGSTVILDGEGFIRYLIVKNVASKDREKRVNAWLRSHPKKAAFFGDNPPGSAAHFKQMHGYRRQRK
jgi:hypothetical protein